MPAIPSLREDLISQIPALRLLMALGYTYLPPAEVNALRGGRLGDVVLDGVLEPWLQENNAITARGRTVPFSHANIREAIRRLTAEPLVQGLVPASASVYERLLLGTSLAQAIDGDTRSYSLRYIDWERPERNVYHVADEFVVRRRGLQETRRPDIVLFVNGIPLVVIECKRPDLQGTEERPVSQAVSQMLRNQRDDEIPGLFLYAQILLAVAVDEALFGTTGTPRPFWAIWEEQDAAGRPADLEETVGALANRPLSSLEAAALYDWRDDAAAVRAHFAALDAAGRRLPTAQDRTLYALLRPERLLELAQRFIVYDLGRKKIARYPQYYAVQATLARAAHLNHQGRRTGGVIWHTTGSGKSLTMVMLAKALAMHPNLHRSRVVIVTDRIDLDGQISDTFKACGETVHRATSGLHLAELIRQRVRIVTTVIDKFEKAVALGVADAGADIFVLVDEGHRSQYGPAHARMQQVLPGACFIAFTGTPLLKAEKSTADKFGGFIHKYSMRQAVEDGAVVPLRYEGRMAELRVDSEAIDRWFDRVTRDLTDEQKADLKRQFSRSEALADAEQRIRQVAYDLSEHYVTHYQGTGLKAQLATSSKAAALRYHRELEAFGRVTSTVVISPPDTREGHDDVYADESQLPAVQAFWRSMMARYGSEKAYLEKTVEDFGRPDGVEILIVVDKLLVGFDEPRNTVLYIDKPLQDHALLQAIARVNRVYEGKDAGLLIDYRGVLGALDEAVQTYDALAGYDAEDVAGTVTDVGAELARLPGLHTALWDVFAPVPNKADLEALQRFLAPEDVRRRFYEALTAYAACLRVAVGTVRFYEETPADRVARYQRDLVFFHNLRAAVRLRYAERVDYSAYEQQVRKLLDTHIQSYEVTRVTEPVGVFDVERFDAEVARLETPAAQADTIAHRVMQAITERMDSDPAFYRRFSKMVQDAIDAYRQGRLSANEYLAVVRRGLQAVRDGQDASLPPRLASFRDARAYYGLLREVLAAADGGAPSGGADDEACAEMAIAIEGIIEGRKVRDWGTNVDVRNQMKADIEDYLFDLIAAGSLGLPEGAIDVLVDGLVQVARHRGDA